MKKCGCLSLLWGCSWFLLWGCGPTRNETSCRPDSCSFHGRCVDSAGGVVCVCDTPYQGQRCEQCAEGYQDNDDNSTCHLGCSLYPCGRFGQCTDANGIAQCNCKQGYQGKYCELCAQGYQDHDNDGVCQEDCQSAGLECGLHSFCEDKSGVARCVCDSGFQDEDGDGICRPDCLAIDCGAHSQCVIVDGEAICECLAGYQDHDADGTCLLDCQTADLDCPANAACVDTSGQARCSCNIGYQDHDADGSCRPNCDMAQLSCGLNAHCQDATGIAQCTCDPGHQDNDVDQNCLPGCDLAQLACGEHSVCSDASGKALCVCSEGYQDHNGDATCLPTCSSAMLDCPLNAHCSDASGLAVCVCDSGYQDHDQDDKCLPSCDIAGLSCWEHASCSDDSGVAQCVCSEGYQDHDQNQTCLSSCQFAKLTCGLNALCQDSSGEAVCICQSGYQDHDADGECRLSCETAELSCGQHALCRDSSGEAICACESGYQDYDADGICLPTCATQALACGQHAQCLDTSGEAVCVCEAGYQDHDGDSDCRPTCELAQLTCGQFASCQDLTGEAGCICDTGYQDHDGDGNCRPTCVTAQLVCSSHASCQDLTGEAMCVCDAGYQDHDQDQDCHPTCETVGLVCGQYAHCQDSSGEAACYCDAGYQDNDVDGDCLVTCANADLACSQHASCQDLSGQALCVCDAGYQDHNGDGNCQATCETANLSCGPNALCHDESGDALCVCESGYQDNDADGVCLQNCALAELACGQNAICDDSLGTSACVCLAGYQDHDGDSDCLPSCAIAEVNCGQHGDCVDASGEALCVCQPGYAGVDCVACDEGYQDNDANGSCLADCELAQLDCLAGECNAASGLALCDCYPGYQDNDHNDTCEPSCELAELDCSRHGECMDDLGRAICVCQLGYAGQQCDVCDEGYQDNNQDGLCSVSCLLIEATCVEHAHCEDDSGYAQCSCDLGYAGQQCDQCGPGYQDSDANGTCEVDCDSSGLLCVHGTCEYEAGLAVCLCEEGYSGILCSDCAAGYQDNDSDTICKPDCSLANLSCESNTLCSDVSGSAVCVCEQGYSGEDCSECAQDYQDTDGDGSCLPSCERLGWSCSGHGQCDYEQGSAICVCEDGYVDDGAGHCLADGDGFSCATPRALSLQSEMVAGSTAGAGDLYGGSCRTDTSQEVVYHFVIDEPTSVAFESSGFDTVLYLRLVCDDSDSEIVCNDDSPFVSGLGSRIEVNLAPGDYYLFVDGYGELVGDFELAILHNPCANESACPGDYQCVPFGDWSGYQCDCPLGTILYAGECVNDPCEPNPCNQPFRGVCNRLMPDAYECSCDEGYEPDPNNPDSCISEPGDACANPFELPIVSTELTGSTTGAYGHSSSVSCHGSGPDQVYHFELEQSARVEFSLTGYDSVLYLQSECGQVVSEIVCNDDSPDLPGGGSYVSAQLQAGDYFLWVDSYNAGGDYVLETHFQPNPCSHDEIACPGDPVCVPSEDWTQYECACPAGYLLEDGECLFDPCDPNPCDQLNRSVCVPIIPDEFLCECDPGFETDPNDPEACVSILGEQCANPYVLGDEYQGEWSQNTANAVNDGCSSSCNGDGPDHVYKFSVAELVRAEFEMVGYDSVLHLRSTCDDVASQVICNDDMSGLPENGSRLVVTLEAGTYYLWADSYAAGGPYSLRYDFRPNPCADEEAVCPGMPDCLSSSDWSDYECVCPNGTLPFESGCADDPCQPNPCTVQNMNNCEAQLPSGFQCHCNTGYVLNAEGECIQDPEAAQWSFIVFLNADNDLESAGYADVAEMGQAGSTDELQIVSLFDVAQGQDQDDGSARIIYITQDGFDTLQNLGEVDMGDWQTLRDFGVWAIENYPARHYALVLWNHGEGWRSLSGDPLLKGFSTDEHGSDQGISIANGDFARALDAITTALGRKLDIVGFDACLMGMWEVAYASAPYADYLVASSETEPFDGWPYHRFLPQLANDNPSMQPAELASSVVDAYHSEHPSNFTLSVTDLNQLDAVSLALNDFANALLGHPEIYEQLENIRQQTQHFHLSSHRDLLDFASKVAMLEQFPDHVRTCAQTLVQQVESSVIHNKTNSGYGQAHGMSIYLPSSEEQIEPKYLSSQWSDACTWDDFLLEFVNQN